MFLFFYTAVNPLNFPHIPHLLLILAEVKPSTEHREAVKDSHYTLDSQDKWREQCWRVGVLVFWRLNVLVLWLVVFSQFGFKISPPSIRSTDI